MTQPSLAQTVPQPPATQQGNQINLNGCSLPGFWYQQQQRVGIADAALMQVMGVELLNTADASQQPVQWFSQATTDALRLTPWLIGSFRYLDITELAQRYGWQVQAQGNVLNIRTRPARVTAVRQGRQTWGDRIVVDLDGPTPWQITEQGEELIVTIDGSIDPALAANFRAGPGNLLTGLRVQTQANQTQLQIKLSSALRPYVWTLPNPNRLVIDIRRDGLPQRDIAWAPGLQWRQQTVTVGSAQFPVVMVVVNPRQAGISVKPIWSNSATAVGTSPLITMAQRWQAVAAINGGFFNRNNQLPLGVVRRDGRWFSGPILNRGAIAWNDAGQVEVGRLTLIEEIVTDQGQRFPVLHLNSGYIQAGLARYTADWGATYTPISDNEVLITVQGDRISTQQTAGPAGSSAYPIPTNGYLLVARSNNGIANTLRPGTPVRLSTTASPGSFGQYPHIMGAGPLLIQNRQIVLNAVSEQFSDAFIRQAASRSAIGVLADGRLMLVAVHNRVGGRGPTLSETAQLMQQLGAVDALNLDGGSSTSLYLGGQLLDRSPRTAARVHNGIGVFIQPTR